MLYPFYRQGNQGPKRVSYSSWLGFTPKQSDSRAKTLTGLFILTIPILICSKANPKGRSLSFSRCRAFAFRWVLTGPWIQSSNPSHFVSFEPHKMQWSHCHHYFLMTGEETESGGQITKATQESKPKLLQLHQVLCCFSPTFLHNCC